MSWYGEDYCWNSFVLNILYTRLYVLRFPKTFYNAATMKCHVADTRCNNLPHQTPSKGLIHGLCHYFHKLLSYDLLSPLCASVTCYI